MYNWCSCVGISTAKWLPAPCKVLAETVCPESFRASSKCILKLPGLLTESVFHTKGQIAFMFKTEYKCKDKQLFYLWELFVTYDCN